MNGYDYPGAISQTLTISQAGIAAIDFYMAGNPDGLPQTKTMDVTLSPATGIGSTSFSFTVTGADTESNMGWVSEQALFKITDPGLYTLTFTSTSAPSTPPALVDSFGPALGGVSASLDVPDGGSTAILLGAGMLGVAGFFWVQKRPSTLRS